MISQKKDFMVQNLLKYNLLSLGVNAKQNDFSALKFKSTIILYL